MTKKQAIKELNALADECVDENYHSEAAAIWDYAIPAVNAATERTVVVVTGVNGVTKLRVDV